MVDCPPPNPIKLKVLVVSSIVNDTFPYALLSLAEEIYTLYEIFTDLPSVTITNLNKIDMISILRLWSISYLFF